MASRGDYASWMLESMIALLALSTALVGSSHRLLVVAPEAFRDALAPYCAARAKSLGTKVEFFSLDDVATSVGVDAPERIKREIFARWKRDGITDVLLVGDVDVMPVRFMLLDRATKAAFDTAFYPSDLYYSDLAHADGSFDDWNGAKDEFHAKFFGEVHGETNKQDAINFDRISYLPEIAVGRWPVSTPEAAREVAAKTLRHQAQIEAIDAARSSGNDASASPRVAFMISGGWIDNQSRAQALIERARSAWTVDACAYFTPEHPPTPTEMARMFARQPSAIFHTGHGQPHRWEGCLDQSILDQQTTSDRPPLLFSIGCSTSEICTLPPYQPYVDVDGVAHRGTVAGEVFSDYPPPPATTQTGAHNTTSLSERAVQMPSGGAIAVIGCVTGSQPCAQTLLDGFIEAMCAEPHQTIGSWWQFAVENYVRAERLDSLIPSESWYPPSIYFQGMKFVLLGDPTLRLKSSSESARPIRE